MHIRIIIGVSQYLSLIFSINPPVEPWHKLTTYGKSGLLDYPVSYLGETWYGVCQDTDRCETPSFSIHISLKWVFCHIKIFCVACRKLCNCKKCAVRQRVLTNAYFKVGSCFVQAIFSSTQKFFGGCGAKSILLYPTSQSA